MKVAQWASDVKTSHKVRTSYRHPLDVQRTSDAHRETWRGTFSYEEVSLRKASFSCKMAMKTPPQKRNFLIAKAI